MTIDNFDFKGKKAIVRVDFNVPLDENGKVTDDTRIRGALPTLKKILNDGGSLIIMSHMGKPKGKVNAKFSLKQIQEDVAKALGTEVKFAEDCAKAADQAANLKPGEVLLLENLRFYPEEEGKPVGIDKEAPNYDKAKAEMKESQKEFAKTLASYADVYVNDAFGTALPCLQSGLPRSREDDVDSAPACDQRPDNRIVFICGNTNLCSLFDSCINCIIERHGCVHRKSYRVWIREPEQGREFCAACINNLARADRGGMRASSISRAGFGGRMHSGCYRRRLRETGCRMIQINHPMVPPRSSYHAQGRISWFRQTCPA